MTRSDNYIWKICMKIYQQTYKEAEPSMDFEKELDAGNLGREDWYMDFYLPMTRQQEIYKEICKNYNCSRYEMEKISMEIWLGSSPSGFKK